MIENTDHVGIKAVLISLFFVTIFIVYSFNYYIVFCIYTLHTLLGEFGYTSLNKIKIFK